MKYITDKAGQTFAFDFPYYVLESNRGNHFGHNRTWKIRGAYNDKRAACAQLSKWANESNGTRRGQRGYTTKADTSAWVDGISLIAATPSMLVACFDESGSDLTSQASVWNGIKHLNPKED